MIVSIRRRRTFAELRHRGQRVKHGAVRLTYLPLAATDPKSTPQVAFALGRKFGTAVERNRARRRLRDAFAKAWAGHTGSDNDELDATLQLHGAFLLSGHRGLLTAPFDRLITDITHCLEQLS